MHYFLFFRLTDEQYRNVIIIISIIVASIILFFVVRFLLIRYMKKSAKNSKKYLSIIELNDKYHFHALQQYYYIQKRQNSKQQFHKFDHNKFFEEYIENNMDFIKALIQKAHENADLFEGYSNDLELINKSIPEEKIFFLIPSFIYNKIKNKEFDSIIYKPVINPCCVCVNRYTSPQGRNSYESERGFYLNDIINKYGEVCEKIKYRETKEYQKEYQRKLLSPSLRYDILKRDGFRCVICGRTAEDDVKLHVDHIIPVSKGGKTVPENLRTLCDSCNLGKSDKYDENGLN